jgi:AraC family transcriptional regulator
VQKQVSGIYRSVSFIENSLTDALSVGELADQSFFSRTHYQRLFREVMGEPVMEYIKKRRLQQACKTLEKSGVSVLDVAVACGYDSYEGFSRAFKAYFGMPPSLYRKVRFNYFKEEKKMKQELKNNVQNHINEVVSILEPVLTDCKVLAETADKTGKAEGNRGGSTLVLAAEYGNLANRIAEFITTIKNEATANEQTVFDLSEKVYRFAKTLDDVCFQFNLLKLLSSVETARIAVPVPDVFADIDTKMDKLVRQMMGSGKDVRRLFDALLLLVGDEVKKDAAAHRTEAAGFLQKLATDGTVLVADIKAAALAEQGRGNAFLCIAKDLEKRVETVKAVSSAINDFSGNRKAVDTAFRDMESGAFFVNVAAFNAAIETARSGGLESWRISTDRIHHYAAQLFDVYRTCTDLFNESIKLTELTQIRKGIPTERRFEQSVEDILFQCEIMFMEMRMETERCNRDDFRAIAAKFEKALVLFSGKPYNDMAKDKKAVSEYKNTLAEINGEYQNAVTTAREHGVAHKVIADEIHHLTKRIENFLNATE